jgi:hypothetical protein
MNPMEIVRPDALKQLMQNINGHAVTVSSLGLARAKLNWPIRSQLPPPSILRSCAHELLLLSDNPPLGFKVDEIPGEYFSVKIDKVRI